MKWKSVRVKVMHSQGPNCKIVLPLWDLKLPSNGRVPNL
jgi:hypothetical protein